MDMKINNLQDNGVTYRGKLKGIAYDAVTDQFTAVATWRASGSFQKADVTAATLPALAVKAIQIIVPV